MGNNSLGQGISSRLMAILMSLRVIFCHARRKGKNTYLWVVWLGFSVSSVIASTLLDGWRILNLYGLNPQSLKFEILQNSSLEDYASECH